MATTLLFNSPQLGSQFNAGSTNVIATVDVAAFSRIRIFMACNNGGQATFNVKILNGAAGVNANTEVDQLANVNIASNSHDSILITDPVCNRLKVTAVIPAFAANGNHPTTRVVVMIFGF